MNPNLSEAPMETDVILYRRRGKPPIIAGAFPVYDGDLNRRWLTYDYEQEISPSEIMGWAMLPHWPS